MERKEEACSFGGQRGTRPESVHREQVTGRQRGLCQNVDPHLPFRDYHSIRRKADPLYELFWIIQPNSWKDTAVFVDLTWLSEGREQSFSLMLMTAWKNDTVIQLFGCNDQLIIIIINY